MGAQNGGQTTEGQSGGQTNGQSAGADTGVSGSGNADVNPGRTDFGTGDSSGTNEIQPDENNTSDTGAAAGGQIRDPYDLYSWDAGTNSYIPYQQAEGSGAPIGKGSGWYYYDAQSGGYQPW